MAGDSRRAVIVGSGVESLTAACLLARRGCETVVLEKRSDIGGTRATWPGVTGFDVPLVLDDTPTVHPEVMRRLGLASHGAVTVAHAPALGLIDAEGRGLELTGDVDRTAATLAARAPRDGDAWRRFVTHADRLAHAVAPLLHRAPPSRQLDDLWTGVLTGRRYLGLSRREVFALLRWPPMPIADLVEETFEDEALRTLVATRGLHGVFAGPKSAGTTAVLLLRAAADGGLLPRTPAHRVDARTLVKALVACAKQSGVDVRTDAEVTRILIERDRVAGVELRDGSRVDAGIVVSGIGPRTTLMELLDPMALAPDLTRRARNIRSRGTIARVLAVVGGNAPLASRAGMVLTAGTTWHLAASVEQLERGFDAMKYGGWAERPWLEMRAHSGRETTALSITVHQVPYRLAGGDTWNAARDRLMHAVIATLDAHIPGLAARLEHVHTLTPDDLARDLGLPDGHPLHAELALDQLWLARPALGLSAAGSPVPGLYLCGPGMHPGVGPAGTSGLVAGRAVVKGRGTLASMRNEG